MTVFTQVVFDHYICKSTDTKPAGRPGETLIEWNTGESFIHNGENWVEDLRQIYAYDKALKG